MKKLILILFLGALLTACDKKTEASQRMSGIWKIESTTLELYENNSKVKDSTVQQQGILVLQTTDGLVNDATTNLAYPPCWSSCFWEIPNKLKNQIFFTYETETTIEAASVMIESISRKKLTLQRIEYDSDLNILRKSTWRFTREKL